MNGEVGQTCSSYGIGKYIEDSDFLRDHLENLGVDGMIILSGFGN
jgi:hypothetical protein